MKYLKNHYGHSLIPPSRRRNPTFQTSNTTKTKKKQKSRRSSFENNLAESSLQTKQMIADYEFQVDAMKKRHGVKRFGISKRQSQDRYDVYRAGYGHRGKHHEIEMDGDDFTSLTDDLTYLQSGQQETVAQTRMGFNKHNDFDDDDDITFLPGSANEPLDVTMYDTFGEEDREDCNINMHHDHPFNHENRRYNGTPQNIRSGRFNSNEWKESIGRRRALFNTDEDDEEDYGEPDENWPGARIPLTEPVQRRQQQNRKQSRRNWSQLLDKLNSFDVVMGETHRGEAEVEESLIMRHQQTETERLVQALTDQRQKFDEEKGALYIDMERLKRDHGLEVDKLKADLDQAQESHQMYLNKLNEVINYHEVLHEKETVAMNKIVEQVKKEKWEEVSKLNRELEELKSAPKFECQTDDPDIQECIKYLSQESEAQKNRRAQFMDTMYALQSIASKTSKSDENVGFTYRDLQDIDGLLDMLHDMYNVAENSHQKTLCMSHMLIEECTELSKTANEFRKMKDRWDSLERESSMPVQRPSHLFRRGREPQADVRGNNFHMLQDRRDYLGRESSRKVEPQEVSGNTSRIMKDSMDYLGRKASKRKVEPQKVRGNKSRIMKNPMDYSRRKSSTKVEPQEVRGNKSRIMKNPMDHLGQSSSKVESYQLPRLPRIPQALPKIPKEAQEACGNSIDELTENIGSFDELTKSMEIRAWIDQMIAKN